MSRCLNEALTLIDRRSARVGHQICRCRHREPRPEDTHASAQLHMVEEFGKRRWRN